MFDSEFDPISTAIASKIDKVAGETGELAQFTSSGGLESAGFKAIYPVGSIYMNAAVGTNPSILLGFGSWSAFGAGRVMVGFDSGNTNFDTAEETGGSADAVVVDHNHTITDAGHSHTDNQATATGFNSTIGGGVNQFSNSFSGTTSTNTTGITIDNEGVSGIDQNLQPYITVYMWKRTA